MSNFKCCLFVILLLTFSNCRKQKNLDSNSNLGFYPIMKSDKFENAAVVSAHYLASEIGKDILKKGGNAIDAAIAVQFALAVVYPIAGNIGGGGFMILRTQTGEYDALDFRETAPIKSHRNMYLNQKGEVHKSKSLLGHLACGVPGTVDGMHNAFQKYSKLKNWELLIRPSINLAETGFKISKSQAKNLNSKRNDFLQVNKNEIAFVKKEPWKENDILIQDQLASTLKIIAKSGRDGFYTGEVAEMIVNSMSNNDGIITLEDLRNYKSVWRKPIISDYKGYEVVSMPPPSSGGVALIQLLESIENYKIEEMGFQSNEAIHLMVEAERRVYADRSVHLGDSDFYDVPIDTLISTNYNEKRMQSFNFMQASKSEEISAGNFKESEQTTHFSILDEAGNAVSLTTTINTAYGSKVVIDGGGFLMNNEMDDFSAKPGVPNFFGLIGNEANAIQPGKRMLSSMTPTIVAKDGMVKIIVGSPGGSTIITSVFQVIVNLIDFKMNANEATQACRFHHQWLPDKIQVEKGCFDDRKKEELEKLGHEVSTRFAIGKVETIYVDAEGHIQAAADYRGDDSVSGY